MEGGPATTWEEQEWKLWNDWWNTTWLNKGDFRECFGWWQLRSGYNYIWIHRQNVAKKIQLQRLWKRRFAWPWPWLHDQDLQNDQYLTLLSRGGLFVPPKELAEFVCSCFAILDFEGDILSIGQVTRSAMYVLKYCGPKCEFCCQYHLDWGIKFASKIVVNVYFNNKQKQAKDSVESFKTRQRRK